MTPRFCRVDAHWAVDVLQPLLAQIGELDLDLASNLIVRRRRDADTSRLSNALKPRGDVDTVPEDVVALYQDVTEIDANPEQHSAINGHPFVPLVHHRLHGYCAFDRVNDRGKLKPNAVTCGLHKSTPVLRHERIGNRAVFTECAGGADLVEAHEP